MDTNKILSADLLDIIFDDRNKDYGAYELRKTYERRIKKSLFFTGGIVVLTFSGVVFASKFTPTGTEKEKMALKTIVIPPIEVPPPVIEPPKKIILPQTKTEIFTEYKIAPPEENPDPPPPQDAYDDAKIDIVKTDGPPDVGVTPPAAIDDGKGIIEAKTTKEDDQPFRSVEVEAKYKSNWEKFLLRNLHGEVPVDNGAPAGTYTVLVQFVVSLDGSVSDIKTLTNHGYGLEQEAIRVIKKSDNWEPAIQNGRPVKAYRKQPITFLVQEN